MQIECAQKYEKIIYADLIFTIFMRINVFINNVTLCDYTPDYILIVLCAINIMLTSFICILRNIYACVNFIAVTSYPR